MNLSEAFDFAAAFHPEWKGKKAWNKPFIYNRAHALRLIGATTNVKKIDKIKLASFRAKLMMEPGNNGTRAHGGVNRIMSMLNSVLRDLAENDIIVKQPKLKPLEENGAREEYFTKEQIEEMLFSAVDIFDDQEIADAIKFAVYTGCRQSELLRLEARDVRLDRMIMTFRDTKNGSTHTLDIHPALEENLAFRIQGETPGTLVFNGFRNKDDLYTRFKKVRDYLGFSKGLVWHSLRHTTGTWLSENGMDVLTIARVLNHKDTKTTARYVKLTDKARNTAINSL